LDHRSYEGYRQELDTLAKKARALLAQRGHYGVIEVYEVSDEYWIVDPVSRHLFVSEDEVISSDNLVGKLNVASDVSIRVQVPVGICSVQVVRPKKLFLRENRSNVVTFFIKPHEQKFFEHQISKPPHDDLREVTMPWWADDGMLPDQVTIPWQQVR
jgi:hypothetical protein